METTEIVPFNLAGAAALLAHLRAEDSFEIGCLGLTSPSAIAEVAAKGHAWLGLAGGRPACAWGVVPGGIMDPASLWLLTTPLIERHRVRFLRFSLAFVLGSLARYGGLDGYVLDRNEQSKRWLTWLGFTLGDPFWLAPVGAVRKFELWLGD